MKHLITDRRFTFRTTHNLVASLLVVLSFLYFACGLDTFYYLEPPKTDGHITKYSSDGSGDRTNYYFSFLTNEEGDNGDLSGSDFNFTGTQVYYKIYGSYSTMVSAQSAIDTLNSSSDISAAATNIINTRGYKTLRLVSSSVKKQSNDITPNPLIKYAGSDSYVYIRLNGIDDEEAYQAVVCTGSRTMSQYDSSYCTVLGYPRRSFDSRYGFNFNADDDNYNPVPTSDDEDVTGTATDGIWYIDMWACSIGRDSSYSASYSKLLHLGSITIREDWYDD